MLCIWNREKRTNSQRNKIQQQQQRWRRRERERKKQPTKQRAQHKLFIDVFKRFVELRSTLAIFLIEHIHIVRALCSRRRGREKKLIRFEILSSLFSFHLVCLCCAGFSVSCNCYYSIIFFFAAALSLPMWLLLLVCILFGALTFRCIRNWRIHKLTKT